LPITVTSWKLQQAVTTGQSDHINYLCFFRIANLTLSVLSYKQGQIAIADLVVSES